MEKLRTAVAVLCALGFMVGCGQGTPDNADAIANNQQLQLSQDALRVGRVEFGHVGSMFGQPVFTWAVYDRHNQVALAGASLPVAAFEDATPAPGTPGEHAMGVVLEMPKGVQSTTFLNHLEFDWEPAGHAPFYFKPHFDFHFYHQTEAEQMAVDCTDPTYPSPDEVAAGYMLPPPQAHACVPMMGYHSGPASDGAPGFDFQKTLIWGYYGGNVTFVEPMITLDTLLQRQTFDIDIPLMSNLGAGSGTRVPTHVRFHYVSLFDAYEITFSQFQTLP